MISYAQNQEDVVLSRLLPYVSRGCFVDVGAAHPILENVTYNLYLQGWRGINIEPMSREAKMLRLERPEDVTLQIALSDQAETVQLFEAPMENRGATTSSEVVVDRYREQGQQFVEFEVDALPLREVWAQHVHGEVHVLKIDVEGMELKVLRGADLHHHRPWVLMIEATAPNSPLEAWAEWEPLVLDAGYQLTLFDGLNRIYVDNQHPELVAPMSTPANVFDDWKPYATVNAEAALQLALERAEGAEAYVTSLVQRALLAEKYVAELEARRKDVDRYVASLAERAARAEEYAAALAADRAEILVKLVGADQAIQEVHILRRELDDLRRSQHTTA